MSNEEVSEDSLGVRFHKIEVVIDDLQSGLFAVKDLQKRLEVARMELEQLTKDVSTLGLFSTNEMIEELPSSSLPFMLIPCYLGQIHQNFPCDLAAKEEQLKLAKIYYIDYLKRSKSYGLIHIDIPGSCKEDDVENEDSFANPFEIRTTTTISADEVRQAKIARFRMMREFQDGMTQAKKHYERSKGTGDGDDELLREQYLKQLQYWMIKIIDEIPMIECEISMLKMMSQRKGDASMGKNEANAAPKPTSSLKPFIITRSEAQKKVVFIPSFIFFYFLVIGLGYPSIPTLTVDQWYEQRFGKQGGPGSMPGPSNAKIHSHGDDEECNSASDDDDDNDEKRTSKMHYDEYKDSHRRGWGNTHNKG